MKTIEIDQDIFRYLLARAAEGESPATVLRRELAIPPAKASLEIDDDMYEYILSKSATFGESASDVLRRELELGGGGAPGGPAPAPGEPQPGPGEPEPGDPDPPRVVVFRIASGTGLQPWNTIETMVRATIGDTLRIFNDDLIPHRLHTSGSPFPHPEADITPGGVADFSLISAFDPFRDAAIYDHNVGTPARFWIQVDPRNG